MNDIVRKLEGAAILDVRVAGAIENGEKALQLLQGHAEIRGVRHEGNHLEIEWTGEPDDVPQILTHLVRNGVPVASFAPRSANLEDVFMKVTAGAVQ